MRKNIAFLGIGLMGKPMASRLLQAGYPIKIWNRTLSKAISLQSDGALIANNLESAVSDAGWHADIIITMLDSGPVVEQVIHQLLPFLKPGMTVVDMSSTRQSEAQKLHALLQEQQVEFIDAPVSGGVIGAEAGTLAIMAGGNDVAYEEVLPVLSVLGRPVYVGAAGTGQLAKLCNQLIVGATINVVAEALLLAQAGGADPKAVRDALRGGFAESRILEVHGKRMLERAFLPGGQVKTQSKDMDNILDAALHAGLELPITRQVAEIYQQMLRTHPTADHSAALLALEERNPGKRLGMQQDQLPSA
jgi:3-hydroxyisobutyrate dehydrogenase-like beta-hydroxyacid dehydrogenase